MLLVVIVGFPFTENWDNFIYLKIGCQKGKGKKVIKNKYIYIMP